MLWPVAVNPVAEILQRNLAQLERVAVERDLRVVRGGRADGHDVVKADGVARDHGTGLSADVLAASDDVYRHGVGEVGEEITLPREAHLEEARARRHVDRRVRGTGEEVAADELAGVPHFHGLAARVARLRHADASLAGGCRCVDRERGRGAFAGRPHGGKSVMLADARAKQTGDVEVKSDAFSRSGVEFDLQRCVGVHQPPGNAVTDVGGMAILKRVGDTGEGALRAAVPDFEPREVDHRLGADGEFKTMRRIQARKQVRAIGHRGEVEREGGRRIRTPSPTCARQRRDGTGKTPRGRAATVQQANAENVVLGRRLRGLHHERELRSGDVRRQANEAVRKRAARPRGVEGHPAPQSGRGQARA